MNKLARNLGMLVISGGLAAPLTLSVHAAALPQTEKQEHQAKERDEKAAKADRKLRVYDAKHNDYHDWTENEDHAYRRYLSEKHEQYEDYGKLTHEKQTEYWEWRHENPDRDDAR